MNSIRRLFETTINDLLEKQQICTVFPLVVAIEAKWFGPLNRVFTGWNGSSGCYSNGKCDNVPILSATKEMLCYPIHAEVMAMAKAAKAGVKLEGATVYMSGWAPCVACAQALIEARIRRIVTPDEIYSEPEKSFALAPQLRGSGLYHFEKALRVLEDSKIEIIVAPEIKPEIKRK